MLRFFLHFVLSVASLFVVSKYIPGVHVTGVYAAVIVVFALLVLNYTIKPILYVLTLPINIITLGLFSFVLNGALLYFVATFIEGFNIDTFVHAMLAAVVISIIKTLGNKIIDLFS